MCYAYNQLEAVFVYAEIFLTPAGEKFFCDYRVRCAWIGSIVEFLLKVMFFEAIRCAKALFLFQLAALGGAL